MKCLYDKWLTGPHVDMYEWELAAVPQQEQGLCFESDSIRTIAQNENDQADGVEGYHHKTACLNTCS